MDNLTATQLCPRDDIAAYIDGELPAELQLELELHVDACDVCGRSLQEQRRLLAEIAASLDGKCDITLPNDFTRRVVRTAESNVTGIRRPREFVQAAAIVAVLGTLAVAAIAWQTPAVASVIGSAGEKLVAIFGFLIKLGANIAFATAVIFRTLAGHVGMDGFAVVVALGIVATLLFISSRWVLRRRGAEG